MTAFSFCVFLCLETAGVKNSPYIRTSEEREPLPPQHTRRNTKINKRRLLSLLTAALLTAGLLAGCGGKKTPDASQEPAAPAENGTPEPAADGGEDYTTSDASLDNPRNQDGIGEDGLLVISFGTSFNDNRRLTIYARMQQVMDGAGYANCFIGTVEAAPNLDDVLALVQAGSYERVVLQPMMIVSGGHANNDMAGGDEDTWKSAFEGAGYEVKCILKGLGEYEAIQNLLAAHAQAAVDQLG